MTRLHDLAIAAKAAGEPSLLTGPAMLVAIGAIHMLLCVAWGGW